MCVNVFTTVVECRLGQGKIALNSEVIQHSVRVQSEMIRYTSYVESLLVHVIET